MNPYHTIQTGDRLTRMLGGKVPMLVTVTGVNYLAGTLTAGAWLFNRDTGMEIDPAMGWDGVNSTGSTLRAPDPKMDAERRQRTIEAAATELFPAEPAPYVAASDPQLDDLLKKLEATP